MAKAFWAQVEFYISKQAPLKSKRMEMHEKKSSERACNGSELFFVCIECLTLEACFFHAIYWRKTLPGGPNWYLTLECNRHIMTNAKMANQNHWFLAEKNMLWKYVGQKLEDLDAGLDMVASSLFAGLIPQEAKRQELANPCRQWA